MAIRESDERAVRDGPSRYGHVRRVDTLVYYRDHFVCYCEAQAPHRKCHAHDWRLQGQVAWGAPVLYMCPNCGVVRN